MSSGDDGEKSEDPTDRRRSQAREQGNIARSVDLTAATLLLAATGALSFYGPGVAGFCQELMQETLSATPRLEVDPATLARSLQDLLLRTLMVVLPMMGLMMAGGLCINLLQVGFLWAPDGLAPKWERLNPLSGLGRIFSLASLVRVASGVGKVTVLGSIVSTYLMWRFPEYWALADQTPLVILSTAGQSLVDLGLLMALSLLTLALIDYGFQFWKHEQDLRMSKQEVREEMKEMDGDPQTRARRRDAHRKLTQARDLAKVPDASVIITNPTELAIAIQYDPKTMPAPTVVAKGAGVIAARIRQIAAENGIPIIERKPLARALYRSVKVGQSIPVDMYDTFVEIMGYVYRLTGRKPPKA